jgi:hypothetical protein
MSIKDSPGAQTRQGNLSKGEGLLQIACFVNEKKNLELKAADLK